MGDRPSSRAARIGLGLLPASRGKGYGSDVVAVLCEYGSVVRGLQRLQIETLADHHALPRAAEHNGFVREGVLRSSAWVLGNSSMKWCSGFWSGTGSGSDQRWGQRRLGRRRHGTAYGYIGSMRSRPGKRDDVVAILLSAAGSLRELGCASYVVGMAADDPDTIVVTEVWESKDHHVASTERESPGVSGTLTGAPGVA